MIGVGTLLTYQKAIERKLRQAQIDKQKQEREKKRLNDELARKKRELVSTALQVSSTAEIITDALKTIDEMMPNHTGCANAKDLYSIKQKLETHLLNQDNWNIFKERFIEVHPNFFDNLKKAHPDFTKSELKFAAYLCIHLSSTQIMTALNISKEAIRKTRHRIRKKTGLDPRDSLEDYISIF